MKTIRHIAGEMVNGIQRCIICGEVICDYTNTLTPSEQPPLKGWPEGDIFISGNMTTIFPPDKFENCE